MKKIFFSIAFAVIAMTLVAQDFCGEIKYKVTIEDNSGRGIADLLTNMFGTEQSYQVCGGSYRTYDQTGALRSLYNNTDNKYYLIGISKDANLLDANQGGVATTNPPEKTEEKFLGRKCKKVTIVSGVTTTTYYYSDDYKVDPSLYTKHQLNGWGAYLAASGGALPLKIVTEFASQKFKITWLATEVNIKPLTQKDFKLPADIVVTQ